MATAVPRGRRVAEAARRAPADSSYDRRTRTGRRVSEGSRLAAVTPAPAELSIG